MGSRLSPETLPDEILILESVVVLREKLCHDRMDAESVA